MTGAQIDVLSDGKKSKPISYKDRFIDVYEKLKTELLKDSESFEYTDDSRAWVEKMLDYNVPGGKLNRGLSVVDSYAFLKPGQLTENEVFLTSALGWCIEWLQAYFLVLDDIMDSSITRRGQPCWYRVPKVGLIAINDGLILRNQIGRILDLYFSDKPYFADLLRLFNQVDLQTTCGQTLDLITTPEGEVDLSKFVLDNYLRIVKFKTAYYSFYLPVACALHVSGENNKSRFESAKKILLQMGTYFQIQDDYLDCYGHPDVIGKVGTDIEDTKCSWLIVQAMDRASSEQKQRIKENYGRKDPVCVAKVKEVYIELEIEKVFLEYEQESYKELIALIEKEESKELQQVLKSFLSKIYKRQK